MTYSCEALMHLHAGHTRNDCPLLPRKSQYKLVLWPVWRVTLMHIWANQKHLFATQLSWLLSYWTLHSVKSYKTMSLPLHFPFMTADIQLAQSTSFYALHDVNNQEWVMSFSSEAKEMLWKEVPCKFWWGRWGKDREVSIKMERRHRLPRIDRTVQIEKDVQDIQHHN
jgi:hypothetical protein